MSNARETFPHAPIVEALFDIRVSLPKSVKLDALKHFQTGIESEYPVVELRKSISGTIALGQDKRAIASSHATELGYQFRSNANDRVLQARFDGFSFSRLKPYTDWANVSQEAFTHWRRYLRAYKPTGISRIALRYINSIDLPNPTPRLEDYLCTRPTLADGLPQRMLGFFLRVALDDEESRAKVIVTQTIDESGKSNPAVIPVILDIDVYRESRFSSLDDDLEKQFEVLHDLKNRVFFESLTERTKELFR